MPARDQGRGFWGGTGESEGERRVREGIGGVILYGFPLPRRGRVVRIGLWMHSIRKPIAADVS
jgi:hypothetical protein